MPKRVYHLGVTATRYGLSDFQRDHAKQRFVHLLGEWDEIEFHHGKCVGGDEETLLIAKSLGPRVRTWAHPAIVRPNMVSQVTSDVELPAKPPLERNVDIVNAIDELLAYPGQEHEVLRSGTWSTIRYARKAERLHAVILPSAT